MRASRLIIWFPGIPSASHDELFPDLSYHLLYHPDPLEHFSVAVLKCDTIIHTLSSFLILLPLNLVTLLVLYSILKTPELHLLLALADSLLDLLNF